MGYLDVMKKCAEAQYASKLLEQHAKQAASLPKELPSFRRDLSDGKALIARVVHQQQDFGPCLGDGPWLYIEHYHLTPHEAVTFAKWILEVFDGMPEDKRKI